MVPAACLATSVLCLLFISSSGANKVYTDPDVGAYQAHYIGTFSDGNEQGSWVTAEAVKYMDSRVFFNHTFDELPNGFSEDKSMLVGREERFYGISHKFDRAMDTTNKEFVFQYEVKLTFGLVCGGTYAKLIRDDSDGDGGGGFDPSLLTSETPYVVMFGPDKCGSTDKVHFIFRHRNPLTGEWEEKHMLEPPPVPIDAATHLYTLVVRPDNSFTIFIDQAVVREGSLLDDFDPPVNPPAMIPDPSDKKPMDWVDEASIPDASARKPDDWDEDAPKMVPNMEATKPAGWLDDEPLEVPDPEAVKPADWDEEEDGEFEAVLVPNPLCESAPGCGVWSRPLKKNPDYKGPWSLPMIPNPAYVGEWAPAMIPNPGFYEDVHPHNLASIAGVAIEIWTMSGYHSFDNFFLGHSLASARSFAEDTFLPKLTAEQLQKELERKAKRAEERRAKLEEGGVLNYMSVAIDDFEDFVDEYHSVPLLSGCLLVLCFGLGVCYWLWCCESEIIVEDDDEGDASAEDEGGAVPSVDGSGTSPNEDTTLRRRQTTKKEE